MKNDMMRVDRKKGPTINKIKRLDIPHVDREILPNGTELIQVDMGTQNLVQLEVLYRGGRILEDKKGVSRATSRLIKEGTFKHTSSQLAEEVDYYGANISSGANLDYSYLKIFSLGKYFDRILPLLQEVIENPRFPEEELIKYKASSIQKLIVENTKSELVAYKTITEALYGRNHPYGYNSTEAMYNDLSVQDMIDCYNSCFGTDNRIVILSGKLTDDIRKRVRDVFGSNPKTTSKYSYKEPKEPTVASKKVIKGEDKLQSAIKIGRRLFKRNHDDFYDFFILNTILGGYFGSRLMSSLREEKGYTYNIYSSIDMMIHDGYFNISTEVGNEYLENTLEGIYQEMDILTHTKVGHVELEMVRNYLSGNFLNMVDGPFKVAGMAKVIALNSLDFDFYSNLMKRIHAVNPEDLLRSAQKYLDPTKMTEIIVGNP